MYEIFFTTINNTRFTESFYVKNSQNHAFVLSMPIELCFSKFKLNVVVYSYNNNTILQSFSLELYWFDREYQKVAPQFNINDSSSVAEENLAFFANNYNPYLRSDQQLFTPFTPFTISHDEGYVFNFTFLNYLVYDKLSKKITVYESTKLVNQLRHTLQPDYQEQIRNHELFYCLKLLFYRANGQEIDFRDEERCPSLNAKSLHMAKLLIQQPQIMNMMYMDKSVANCLYSTNKTSKKTIYCKELHILPNVYQQLQINQQ